MAKIGSEDARWIVADRKDGTNVHNWHWAEKDVTRWAHRRLQELLGELQLSEESSGLHATTSTDLKVTGEASINNRKNKLIPAYELVIEGVWIGELKERSGSIIKLEGSWKVPYLAEENANEDPEIVFSYQIESAAQRQAKSILRKHGAEAIARAVKNFVHEIATGGPLTITGSAIDAANASAPSVATNLQAQRFQGLKSQKKINSNLGQKEKRIFRANESFYARASDIFECFTNSQRIQAYTQSPAKVVAEPGGRFEIFDGSVVGTFKQISANSRIILDWRFRSWQEHDVSEVELVFKEAEVGTTIVTLKHSNIPEEDQFGNADVYETTAAGWKQQIFHKIRAVFGYGLGL